MGGLTATELARTPGGDARISPHLGAMAQLVARLVRNEKVGGSNPPSSTTSQVCPASKLAGQTCFRGDFGQGIDAGVSENARSGLAGCVGGVLLWSMVIQVNSAQLSMRRSAGSHLL